MPKINFEEAIFHVIRGEFFTSARYGTGWESRFARGVCSRIGLVLEHVSNLRAPGCELAAAVAGAVVRGAFVTGSPCMLPCGPVTKALWWTMLGQYWAKQSFVAVLVFAIWPVMGQFWAATGPQD